MITARKSCTTVGDRYWFKWIVFGIVLAFSFTGIATSEMAAAESQPDVVKLRIHMEDPDAQAGVFNLKDNTAVIEPPQGYVEIFSRESRFTARKVVYSQADDTAKLTGDVTVERKDLNVTARAMRANFATEDYELEGDVYLVRKETTGEQAGQVKLEIWADWVHVSGNGNEVTAKGHVRLVESERRAWADELYYDDEKEIATLVGSVRVETSDGDVLTGNKMVVNRAADEAIVYGPTTAEFIIENSEEDQGQKRGD